MVVFALGIEHPLEPIRANMVGLSRSATKISASIAACHSLASCSAFDSLEDVDVSQINATITNRAAPDAANVQIVHRRNTSKVSLACMVRPFAEGRPGACVNRAATRMFPCDRT
jgi:hypothetical protein